MADTHLEGHLGAYAEWREEIVNRICDYRNWLNEQELNDAQVDQRIDSLLARLNEDKLNVAFIAEFSRGKSELINAIFFAGHGRRLLPSTAGRTTMCPTELMYDSSKPHALQLLPIDTRAFDATTTEYKKYPEEWTVIEFDINSSESMAKAFEHVSQTKRVSLEVAEKYELFNPKDDGETLKADQDGMVDIPCWRYAVINMPHPLLEKGLVVFDTPGLNAVGTEPELTLNMLPNAHAVLFVLAADTGVTKSEMEVWQQYVSGSRWNQKGRMAVLNKIDGLWDELKTAEEVEKELERQIDSVADLLTLDREYIFPTSAQKGLLGKVNCDEALIEQSQLIRLERALSEELIPAKKAIVHDSVHSEIETVVTHANRILEARLSGVVEQLDELRGLRGKNEDVVEHMMNKVKQDKEQFEKGLQRFQALRSVFSQQANKLFTLLGMEALKAKAKDTRQTMVSAKFTKTLRDAMDGFFDDLKERLVASDEQIAEIKLMMDVMYEKFSKEHGLRQSKPVGLSMLAHQKELEKLEAAYREQFNTTLNMMTHEKVNLTAMFFNTLASRVVHIYKEANMDVDAWLKSVISPMESQVREHQLQLRRRLESVKRIYKATDTLEDRILELDNIEKSIRVQMDDLQLLKHHMENALALEDAMETERVA